MDEGRIRALLGIPVNVPPGWRWHDSAADFCDAYGVPRAWVEAAAEHPTSVSIDPMTHETGYPLVQRRRGDLSAICSYRDVHLGLSPMIVYARVHLPLQESRRYSGGAGGTNTAPKSMRAIKARIVSEGFRLQVLGSGHFGVIAPDGQRIYVLAASPSEYRGLTNAWMGYVHARDKWAVRARIAEGDLLNTTEGKG